jgi:hypothetical protein
MGCSKAVPVQGDISHDTATERPRSILVTITKAVRR